MEITITDSNTVSATLTYFDIEEIEAALTHFQRSFRPGSVSGPGTGAFAAREHMIRVLFNTRVAMETHPCSSVLQIT